MRNRPQQFLIFVITAVGAMVSAGPAGAASLHADIIRASAARAMATLQSSQAVWDAKQPCASCHHQLLPALAFRSARQHGIPLDEKEALSDLRHSFDYSDLETAILTPRLEPAAATAYKLVAAEAAGMRPNPTAAMLVHLLISVQKPDGRWTGTGQRPPLSYSVFTNTAVASKAVQVYHDRRDSERAAAAVARARAWLASHEAPDTEGRTFQLLGLLWTGGDFSLRKRLGKELAATQRADGGWSSIDGRESEAYSTGQALVALRESAGVSTADPRWQRGLEFLVRTEAGDGTWHVPSRLHEPARLSPPYFESGYPYGHDQFISAAGANWAIMALADALPRVSSPHPAFPNELTPHNPEPWVETMLFGTAADVKRLLDRGFDPNSAKLPGGTSALMMAASDVAKIRLLLEHGADVNARSQTGWSALGVAAHYGRAGEAINLLLDSGARVAVRETDGSPDSQVLGIAAHSGNWRVLPRLRQAGSELRVALRFEGVVHSNAALAVRDGDCDVLSTLLDLGIDVNESKPDPWSLLGRAVVNNYVDVARLLLARGANANFVDRFGYTPLLLAASVDFGDSAMLELLLASGADIRARTKQGESALDLARKYGHARFVKILESASGKSNTSP